MNRSKTYSELMPQATLDLQSRRRKAHTVSRVIERHADIGARELLAEVGGSTGAIAAHLADAFRVAVNLDVDRPALIAGHAEFSDRITCLRADGTALPLASESCDLIICNHVYEHVSDPQALMDEIYRALKPGAYCYFSAGNKIQLVEPHHRIPLLSLMPQWLADRIVRATGRDDRYRERHLYYSQLRKLVGRFELHDVTDDLVRAPSLYRMEYLLTEGSATQRVAQFVLRHFRRLFPTYIWLLRKPVGKSPG